jgi:hypothetical protein
MTQIYIRDLELLLNLQNGLSQFNYGVKDVLKMVDHDISTTQNRLVQRTDYWRSELRKREDALDACRVTGSGDCSYEAQAVRQAQDALEKLKQLSSRLEKAIGEYRSPANRLDKLVNSKMSKAKGDIDRSIQKYQSYLAQQSQGSSSSGHRTHDYTYQKERHKFILNTIREDPAISNVPNYIRGELETSYRRVGEHGYIPSPKGYDVGHKIPGWNHWSNFRWEDSWMNSYRGGKFKR